MKSSVATAFGKVLLAAALARTAELPSNQKFGYVESLFGNKSGDERRNAERSFAQRADAIGVRYDVASRIEGYNISQGRAISIMIFRSEGSE